MICTIGPYMKSWRKSHSLPLLTGEYFITGLIIIVDYNGPVLMKHIPGHRSCTEKNLQRDSVPLSLLSLPLPQKHLTKNSLSSLQPGGHLFIITQEQCPGAPLHSTGNILNV